MDSQAVYARVVGIAPVALDPKLYKVGRPFSGPAVIRIEKINMKPSSRKSRGRNDMRRDLTK